MCPGRCCLGLTNSAPGVGSLSTSFSPLFTYETLRKLPPDSKFSSSISASPDRASSPTVGDELSLHNEKSAVSIPRTRHKSAKSALKQDTQISNSSVEDPCGKQDESAARWRGGTDERVPLPTDQGFAARLAANALANVRGCPGGQDALSSLSGNLFLAPEWERKVQHCLRWFYVEYIELGTQDLDVPASGVRTVLPPPVGVVSRQSTGLFLQGRTTSRRLIPFGAHHCLRCPPSPVLPAIQEPLARFLSFATFLLNQSSTSTEGRSDRAAILLKGPRGSGKRTLARHACQQLGFHFKEIDGLALSQGASGTAAAAGSAAIHVDGSIAPGTNSRFSAALVEAASEATPVLIYIRRMHMLYRYVGGDAPIGADMHRLQVARELIEAIHSTDETCSSPILQVSPTEVAEICTGLSAAEVHSLFHRVLHDKVAALSQAQSPAATGAIHPQETCKIPPIETMTATDFRRAVKAFRSDTVDTTVPTVHWQDVGGIETAKQEIRDYISLPLERPELFDGLKTRGGILLFGPPGTGKTLLAKAVATECGVNFISVKGPELLNMYIGESEKNVRMVFQKARACKPSVLFFDELDALLPRRGRTSDSAGVLDRIVAQLLAEIDGLPSNVFVIGSTNRIELIDKAVLRAGRLDRCVYIGIEQNRIPLLETLTRHMTLEETCQDPTDPSSCTGSICSARRRLLETVNNLLPPQFTGADCKSLCSIAGLLAAKEKINFLNDMSETLNIPAIELQELLHELEVLYASNSKIRSPPGVKSVDNHTDERRWQDRPSSDFSSCTNRSTETRSRPSSLRCRLPLEQQAPMGSRLLLILEYDRFSNVFTRSTAGIQASFQVWRIVPVNEHATHPADLHLTCSSTELWCVSRMPPEDLTSFFGQNTPGSEAENLPEFVLEPSSIDDRHRESDGLGGRTWRNCDWLLNGRRAFLWKSSCTKGKEVITGRRDVDNSEIQVYCGTAAQDKHHRRKENIDDTLVGIQTETSAKPCSSLADVVVHAGPPPHEILLVKVGERHFHAALAQTRPSLSSQDIRHYEKMKQQYESVRRSA
uniref:Peroxisomal ATPase PEX6 n=1 Tax=Toxoplasma gondii COUG TaxID=1074873 RepID=A0A2G8Y8B1_TOXGO|nr:ATPase, AAA family protein [Toxoplasma gondii COUG]